MNGVPTTVIDVFRDADATAPAGSEDRDVFGDEVETPRQTDLDPDDDPYLDGVPASIIEQTRRVPDVTSGDLRTVRFVVGRASHGLDIRRGDIVLDRSDGARYRVDAVASPQNPAMPLDLRFDLTRA